MLGVATPSDLIADKKRTPFNIGRAIELTGFTLEEAKVSLIQGFVGNVDNSEALLQEVLEWTQGQPFLTQKLCKIVIDEAESKQPNIEQLVQKYLIQNWQFQDEPEHLRTIRNRITSNERRAGRMLGIYQQILLTGSVAADDSSEQARMSLSGLVVKQSGKLKVYNRVYECVFNLSWVEKELAKLRPYAEAFKAWIDSGCTDKSRLLRGEALNDALAWAANKSLSDRDYQFFTASQEFENREIQRARELEKLEAEINLEAERRKLEAQNKANKILKAANQKANKQVRFAAIIFVVSLVAAVWAGIWATNTITETRTAVRLEREGVNAIKLFESQEIEPLLLAMQTGQELKELVKDGRPLEKYPAGSPQLALQTILDNIHEQNKLKGHTFGVKSASFSPDGKRIVTASDDKTARVWDISGKLLAELKGHTGEVWSPSFSPDGQRIVTVSEDKTARVWDISGKQLAELKGHTGEVWSPSFSPDGKRIVTASDDKTARVWDISGKQLAELKGHTDTVTSASFSADGQRIVTASLDNTARVWRVEDLNQLLVRGCKWLNNYLITHAKDLEKLEICQNKSNIMEAAPFLVKEGEEQAREGSVDDAVATFGKALKWNPKLKLDPETKAKQIAEAEKLVEKGENLLKEGKVEDAVAVFQLALKLDPNLNIESKTKATEALLEKGEKLVEDARIKEAIAAYTKAQKLQPEVEISANSWNRLCRRGSLLGYATDVMYACEKAVIRTPDIKYIRDSRGIAMALIGNTAIEDFQAFDSRGIARALTGNTNGAIEDFQAFIAQTKDKEEKSQRQRWIDALRAGKKPFTEEELKKLF